MGGGGHDQVAAFQYAGSYMEMFEKLMPICKEELKNHPQEQHITDLFGGDDENIK